jgi:hypothetical protein
MCVVNESRSCDAGLTSAERNLEEVCSGVAWGVNPRTHMAASKPGLFNESRSCDAG